VVSMTDPYGRILGFLDHITNLIKKPYEVNTCEVVHEGKLHDTIAINTGVRQGCILIGVSHDN
jgi:hypothetical protein